MLPHGGPGMQADPRQAAQGARSSASEVPGSSSCTNIQDHWQRPVLQQPAPQNPAATYAARMSSKREGDISISNINVKTRGSFIRGNIRDAPSEKRQDRTFLGDVEVGEDANYVDQNQGWGFPDIAFQQNRNKTSDAPQSPPEQESDKPDGHEIHGLGGSCCRLQ